MPLAWTAGTVVIVTAPNLREPPKRTSCDALGSPPNALSFAAKNFGISENTLYKIEKGQRWGHVSIEDEEETDKKPDFVVE